jgi:hypothetical protein
LPAAAARKNVDPNRIAGCPQLMSGNGIEHDIDADRCRGRCPIIVRPIALGLRRLRVRGEVAD